MRMDERGSNFDYVELPLATNNEEMTKIINGYKSDKELNRRDKFLQEFDVEENGTATHAVVDCIIQVLKQAKENIQ